MERGTRTPGSPENRRYAAVHRRHNALFLTSGDHGGGPEGGYLGVRSKKLLETFEDARAGFERERFGPAGEMVKDLDAKLEQFVEHLGNTVDAARMASDLVNSRDATTARSFLQRVARIMTGKVIDDPRQLEARRIEMIALLKRLREVAGLHDDIARLHSLADAEEEHEGIEDLRRDLVAEVDLSPSGDLKGFRERAQNLRGDLADADAPPAMALPLDYRPGPDHYPAVVERGETSPGDEVRATREAVAPRHLPVVQQLSRSDLVFTLFSGVFVLLSGMVALYLKTTRSEALLTMPLSSCGVERPNRVSTSFAVYYPEGSSRWAGSSGQREQTLRTRRQEPSDGQGARTVGCETAGAFVARRQS